MKTDIYTLLGMIKDGKAPKKILWKDKVFGLSEDNKNYIDEDSDWLFIDYEWLDMLNDEIIILETTITYKPDKIEKLEITQEKNCKNNWKWKLNGYNISTPQKIMGDKINEIIDRWNNV